MSQQKHENDQTKTDISQDEDDQQNKVWGQIVPLNSQKLKTYDLIDNNITIGRNSNNIIHIQDSRLSGFHCSLDYKEDKNEVYLNDLSTNGTYILGRRVGKGNLKKQKWRSNIFITQNESR
ncbi:hypothetical protein IMG5_133500 [Ichthyophthirius multifiliis]|uniref:FHA domain-containing protein n=1 Tax=Ichthyophthirius multifiliis TaxID=5932 RepID=G0QWM4_ICHMU|nr:hypothetical protein IMG5_133500 [Ichthyophthirius multifiliis]EGR30383.1 hypothetical protein IMG5_133500 [Ichthyophthirius multifiliis]|eukprot:XP_004031970.1 hypothetical protein IMG5_133500 [Ichthyophthirius multifiliis]